MKGDLCCEGNLDSAKPIAHDAKKLVVDLSIENMIMEWTFEEYSSSENIARRRLFEDNCLKTIAQRRLI